MDVDDLVLKLKRNPEEHELWVQLGKYLQTVTSETNSREIRNLINAMIFLAWPEDKDREEMHDLFHQENDLAVSLREGYELPQAATLPRKEFRMLFVDTESGGETSEEKTIAYELVFALDQGSGKHSVVLKYNKAYALPNAGKAAENYSILSLLGLGGDAEDGEESQEDFVEIAAWSQEKNGGRRVRPKKRQS